jgi:hypothetical protein
VNCPDFNGNEFSQGGNICPSGRVVLDFSSQVSCSLQFSTGQLGAPFSKLREQQRAGREAINIHHDPEEKTISLAQRAVTEMMARESDHPKENVHDGVSVESPTPSELNDLVGPAASIITHISSVSSLTPSQFPASPQYLETEEAVINTSTAPEPMERTQIAATTQRTSDSSLVTRSEGWRFSPPPGPHQSEVRKVIVLDELIDVSKMPIPQQPTPEPQEFTTLQESWSMSVSNSGIRVVDDPYESPATMKNSSAGDDVVDGPGEQLEECGSDYVPTVDIASQMPNALQYTAREAAVNSKADIPTCPQVYAPPEAPTNTNANSTSSKFHKQQQPNSPWKDGPPGQSIFGSPEDESQHFDDAMDHHV